MIFAAFPRKREKRNERLYGYGDGGKKICEFRSWFEPWLGNVLRVERIRGEKQPRASRHAAENESGGSGWNACQLERRSPRKRRTNHAALSLGYHPLTPPRSLVCARETFRFRVLRATIVSFPSVFTSKIQPPALTTRPMPGKRLTRSKVQFGCFFRNIGESIANGCLSFDEIDSSEARV